VKDAVESNIVDLYITKYWAIKFATAAACTVLRVDQVFMLTNFSVSLQTRSQKLNVQEKSWEAGMVLRIWEMWEWDTLVVVACRIVNCYWLKNIAADYCNYWLYDDDVQLNIVLVTVVYSLVSQSSCLVVTGSDCT